MKRALVTGGAGFIGSHLCERLIADGWYVVCLDNFTTSARVPRSAALGSRRFEVIRADVRDAIPASVGDVDAIYHLACPASPVQYQRDPVGTMLINVMGAHNVLEYALEVDARALLASTSEVYGEPLKHPQREEYRGNVSTTGPRACYDEGKRAAETLFTDYGRDKGADTAIVRIFNTYGPHMQTHDGRVVSNFITQALRGEPLTVYGDGSQTRSLCYVDDLIVGLVAVMDSPSFEPVNLGNPIETTVLEIARMVSEIAGRDFHYETAPLPEDDPTRRRPDISRAVAEFGWCPKVTLRDGLQRTFDWFEFNETFTGEEQ